MKKLFFSFLLSITSIYVFSQIRFYPTNAYRIIPWYIDEGFSEKNIFNGYRGIDPQKYSDGVNYPNFIEIDKIFYKKYKSNYLIIDKQNIKANEYGFQFFSCKGKKQYLIQGGNYYAIKFDNFFYEDNRINVLGEIFHKVYNSKDFNHDTLELKSSDKNLSYDWESYASRYVDYSYLICNLIKSVKMNVPFLQETIKGNKIVYDDDILKFRWFTIFSEALYYDSAYANCTKPMVEGDAGNGVGVEINVDFYIPSDNIVILNGYADWNKQHLYKQNARMKKVKVEGEGFSLEYDFEDYVHFSQIDFPKKTNKVKITVLEVYDGSKWADMAISGMWVNPDVTKTANSKIAEEYLEYAQQHCVEFEE